MVSGKRKFNVLNLEERIRVIREHKQNRLSSRKLAAKYSCGKTQIYQILSNADELTKAWEDNLCLDTKRKREEKYAAINEPVFEWFKSSRAKGISVSGALVREKALEIAKELGIDDFSASNGWLNRFRIRKNINFKKGGKSGSLVSEQNNEDSNLLPNEKEEVVVPDIEMRCTEMEAQSGPSTSFLSNSDIIFKQEIIEAEQESNVFDDSSFHSSIADDPSETQFDGQTPSTSCITHSESSNSNLDTFPGERARDDATVHCVKVESDVTTNSRDRTSEAYDITSNVSPLPSVLNFADPEVSSRQESVQPRGPFHTANSSLPTVVNVTGSESSLVNDKIQAGVTSQVRSPSLHQVLNSTSHGNSCNNVPMQPGVRPRDRFDAFGEFIASKLRNLDQNSSVFVQTAFADLLFKAELGMFLNTGQSSFPAPRTNDIQKNTPPANDTPATVSSLEKENIQPIPSHIRNPYLHLPHDVNNPSPISSSRNQPIQPRTPPNLTDPSFPPVFNNTGPESSLRNEPMQPRLMSYVTNPWPSPVVNVAVPESSSRNNPNQTRVSHHIGPQTIPPALNQTRSWSNMPIQSRVPFHMRPRDEFDAYGEFAASKLRTLDPRSCAYVQTAFADLIFEAELGRFLSEGEKSIFANRTNDILRNMPPAHHSELGSMRNVISNLSRYEAQPQWNLAPPGFPVGEIPLEFIPNLHSVHK